MILKSLKVRYFILGLGLAIALYIASIPVRLAVVKERVPAPQAIFVLGGGGDREEFAAKFARRQADLDVWVSTRAISF